MAQSGAMIGLGLLVLRLTVGAVLVAHGAHDLFGALGGPGIGPGGLKETAAHFTAIGLAPGMVAAVVAGFVQLVGGGLIAIGVLTRWAALSVIGYLSIEIWKDQMRWGFFMNWLGDAHVGHGMEYSIALIGILTCLALAGGGEWSFDGARTRTRATRTAGRARLRRG